jgi:3'-phosphoadenosine 5'-phosphosulfate sulfotransferase (PAPS reductase)/FAD synthetase
VEPKRKLQRKPLPDPQQRRQQAETKRVAAKSDLDLILNEKIPPADAYLVAYSGGKDSLAVLDILARAGKDVRCYFMYFVPGLDYTKFWCDFARKRWGVDVIECQHWSTSRYLRQGLFRARPLEVPRLSIADVEAYARLQTKRWWIGYGYKKFDSLERRGMITGWYNDTGHPWSEKRGIFAPVDHWNDGQVISYLQANDIPVPGLGMGKCSGVSTAPYSMEWLRTEWPDDYKRILKVFPYAAAQADKMNQIREWKEQRRQMRLAERRAAKLAAQQGETSNEPHDASDL